MPLTRLNDGLDFDEPEDLLTATEIAAMWRLNRRYVSEILSKRPGFPNPAINFGKQTRRWKREDLERYREKQARKR